MLSEWSGPHHYSAFQFQSEETAEGGRRGVRCREERAGSAALFGSGHRGESWDKSIVQNVGDVVLAVVLVVRHVSF